MKKAKFVMAGWMGEIEHEFSGETWADVMREFSNFQDLGCLARHACMMGAPGDSDAISSLMAVADKCWNNTITKEELADFNCTLSIGGIRCVSAEDEDGKIDFCNVTEPGMKSKKPVAKRKRPTAKRAAGCRKSK